MEKIPDSLVMEFIYSLSANIYWAVKTYKTPFYTLGVATQEDLNPRF